jgi:carboxymethylenebutenolidase
VTDLTARTVRYAGHLGDDIVAYDARPLADGPFPGLVVIHHTPGWDEGSLEVTRRFAHHGVHAIVPNLYSRVGHLDSPTRAAAAVREAGGLADAQLVGDVDATVGRLRADPTTNGRVGLIGFCSGGRHAFLAACRLQVDAIVDCYGGGVIADPTELNEKRPVAPIDLAADLSGPLLGIFGEADPHVPPNEVAELEAALRRHGKVFRTHSYADTGHAFLSPYSASYDVASAKDAWGRIFAFLEETLSPV